MNVEKAQFPSLIYIYIYIYWCRWKSVSRWRMPNPQFNSCVQSLPCVLRGYIKELSRALTYTYVRQVPLRDWSRAYQSAYDDLDRVQDHRQTVTGYASFFFSHSPESSTESRQERLKLPERLCAASGWCCSNTSVESKGLCNHILFRDMHKTLNERVRVRPRYLPTFYGSARCIYYTTYTTHMQVVFTYKPMLYVYVWILACLDSFALFMYTM